MNYTPTQWTNNKTNLDAEKMNNIENGISELTDKFNNIINETVEIADKNINSEIFDVKKASIQILNNICHIYVSFSLKEGYEIKNDAIWDKSVLVKLPKPIPMLCQNAYHPYMYQYSHNVNGKTYNYWIAYEGSERETTLVIKNMGGMTSDNIHEVYINYPINVEAYKAHKANEAFNLTIEEAE